MQPLVRVHGVGQFRVDQVERPLCRAQDVVVAVQQCGICGSDLGYIAMGGLPSATMPMPLGHEFSAVVVEVGAQVTHVRPGQRVVVNPVAGDGPIGNGGPEGAFSPYLRVRDLVNYPAQLLLLPEALDDELGALVEPLSVSMHAIARSGVQPGESLVIFGAGPIGLGALLVARYRGVTDCVVIDRSETRLALARQLGGQPLRADRTEVLAQALVERFGACQGQPDVAVYLEATGNTQAFEQCVQLARTGSTVTVVGVHKQPASLDLLSVLAKELTITAAMAYPEEFPAVIEMLACGGVDARPLITHRFPLSNVEAAMAMAADPEQAVKVLVDCQR